MNWDNDKNLSGEFAENVMHAIGMCPLSQHSQAEWDHDFVTRHKHRDIGAVSFLPSTYSMENASGYAYLVCPDLCGFARFCESACGRDQGSADDPCQRCL